MRDLVFERNFFGIFCRLYNTRERFLFFIQELKLFIHFLSLAAAMALTNRIENFSCLVVNNYYTVSKVESYKTQFTDNQLIYTLSTGRKLYGRPGIDRRFKKYTVPFYFCYKGMSHGGLFMSYEFSLYQNVKEVLSVTYCEISRILMDYIINKACSGCVEKQPNQLAHICLTESHRDLCERYLEEALMEHPKYQLGNILDAFIDYEAEIGL